MVGFALLSAFFCPDLAEGQEEGGWVMRFCFIHDEEVGDEVLLVSEGQKVWVVPPKRDGWLNRRDYLMRRVPLWAWRTSADDLFIWLGVPGGVGV